MEQAPPAAPHDVAEEQARYDALRAENYALLGALMAAPPTADLLGHLAGLEPDGNDDSAIGAALRGLAGAAATAAPEALGDEYYELFIGLGRGELVPYGSWYQTGFLMERPLTLLRDDLVRLGFQRQEGVKEPEDHIAALCEVMAMLIGDPGFTVDYTGQRAFYNAHLAPFVARFWRDLEQAQHADFYRAVGRLGAAFTELETKYFRLPE